MSEDVPVIEGVVISEDEALALLVSRRQPSRFYGVSEATAITARKMAKMFERTYR